MRRRNFNLVDEKGNILYSGTYEACMEKSPYKIVQEGDLVLRYRATFEDGSTYEGTVDELCEELEITKINLYNYTNHARKKDGLKIERI